MNNKTKKKLEFFAKYNNWESPDALDQVRFFQFIIEAYHNDDRRISVEEFLETVRRVEKVKEDDIQSWADKYESGIELLEVYNKEI